MQRSSPTPRWAPLPRPPSGSTPEGPPSRARARVGLAALAALALPFAVACDRPAGAESLQSWKPVDHHSTDDDKASGAQGPRARGAAGGKSAELAQLVELAWRQQCVQCHGAVGRGDGPMALMTHPRDLSDPSWQAQVTDDALAASIKGGKGKMPKFDLPDAVVAGLVARVRGLRAP